MTGRLDKVDTSVNTVIDQFEPVDSVLLLEVGIESCIDIVDNGFPAGLSASPLLRLGGESLPLVVVYEITESRGIDHRQFQPHTSFLDIYSSA